MGIISDQEIVQMVGTEDFIMTAFSGSIEECHKVVTQWHIWSYLFTSTKLSSISVVLTGTKWVQPWQGTMSNFYLNFCSQAFLLINKCEFLVAPLLVLYRSMCVPRYYSGKNQAGADINRLVVTVRRLHPDSGPALYFRAPQSQEVLLGGQEESHRRRQRHLDQHCPGKKV